MSPFLIAALVIAAIWGVYLFPSLMGSRKDAPLNSTEEFDKWTHVMADVQRRPFSASSATARDVIRTRRRRTLAVLIAAAAVTLILAYVRSSLTFLLAHVAADALLVMYVAMLRQVKTQRAALRAVVHAKTRPHDADDPQVRVVAGQ